jgi:transcriptional regulator with XRE-family HTH domain
MTIKKEGIGRRIKVAIDQAKIKQKTLAQALGISESSVTGYVQGVSEPSATGFAQIAELTGRSIDWLITGQETEADVLAKLSPEQAAKVRSVLHTPDGTHKVTSSITPGWNNQLGQADLDLVKQVIEAVMEHLQQNQLTMPPAKIAELVTVLYEEISESEEKQVNKGTVARLIKLAS